MASWNVAASLRSDLDSIIAQLEAIDADIVLIQELDSGVERSDRVDQPRAIARQLGYAYSFAPTLELQGGLYGIAVLSRLPFRGARSILLDSEDSAEPRAALDAEVCLGGRTLHVVNHHADYHSEASEKSINDVLSVLKDEKEPLVIFGGDFNQLPDEPGPQACAAAGLIDAVRMFDERPTRGSRRIDYIFVAAALAARQTDASVVDTGASDHRLIVVDFDTP